jgi:6-pyruvoyltetrahydropterin/6-carboxytetrahydropterin synthase
MIFRRKFEAAHRLIHGVNANTLCSQPHGHTWEVLVGIEHKTRQTLDGTANVLIPFAQAKGDWHRFVDGALDHACFLGSEDPLVTFLRQHNPDGRLLITKGDPTTEALACLLLLKLKALLEKSAPELQAKWIHVQETQTNAIRITSDEAQRWLGSQHDPKTRAASYWWSRADMSTHDL